MFISICDYRVSYDTHDLYDVLFYNERIRTLVTHSAQMVVSWLSEVRPMLMQNPIVGLDVEWRPNNRYYENPVATLQLCVGNSCLIYQLLYTEGIPQALFNFLNNGRYMFVGAGIDNDVAKLDVDYGLEVANAIDLREWAANDLCRGELHNAGLKGLARVVLGMEFYKPKHVTRSRWDNEYLTYSQIQYACLDAYVSSEIGRSLNA